MAASPRSIGSWCALAFFAVACGGGGEGLGGGQPCGPGIGCPAALECLNNICVGPSSEDAGSGTGSDVSAPQQCVPTELREQNCVDNVDNDCDDRVDLNDSDCWPSCMPTAVETCNNVDDNCNQQIDEGVTQACTEGGQSGTQTCTAGAWGDCVTQGPPPVEICDNQDNDGDAHVDEDLGRACNTACGSGVEECAGGTWVGCDAPAPATEVCDGEDNNCDGEIDEALTRTCENECGAGTETCSLGTWSGCTAPRPAVEQCDDRDNDCDGTTDEEVMRTCSTTCGEGVQVCNAGTWAACSERQPAADETCDNNIDDDCNGTVDDNIVSARDTYENNSTCSSAYDLGTIPEESIELSWPATLYPAGDVDWYLFYADEANHSCFPGTSQTYTVRIRLVPPSGADCVDYDVYLFDDGCGTQLGRGYAGGCTAESFTYSWSGTCILNDSRNFRVEVVGYGGVWECRTYRLYVDMY